MVYSILPNCRIKHLILNCLQYNKALVSMAYPALFLLLFLLEPPAMTVQASRWCRSIPPAKPVPSHGRRNGMRLLNPTHSHLLIVWIFLTVYSFFRYQDLLFQSMVWNLTDKTVQGPEQLGHSWSCAGEGWVYWPCRDLSKSYYSMSTAILYGYATGISHIFQVF